MDFRRLIAQERRNQNGNHGRIFGFRVLPRAEHVEISERNGFQAVKPGEILVRQRGTKILPGKNVRTGSDYTLYAVRTGFVKFQNVRKTRFDGTKRYAKLVSVVEKR